MTNETINYGSISKKYRYALRAIFELTFRRSEKPVKVHELARSQAIPLRFLEIILHELKQGGFVKSQRGKEGGYMLNLAPSKISVGQVISFLKGSSIPAAVGQHQPKRLGDSAFFNLWEKLDAAVSKVYDETTFADLRDTELVYRKDYIPDYVI